MNDDLKTGDAGLNIIKLYEGFKSEAYLCPANVWTIGYGTTAGVKPGMKIDRATADMWLRRDVELTEAAIKKLVKVPLKQYQFDALVSFVYNIGRGNFEREATTLKRLNKGDYEGAADAMLWWNKGGGRKLLGLVRRRAAEKALFNGRPVV